MTAGRPLKFESEIMKKAFKIKYNDSGESVCIAETYSEAESKFLNSGYGGDDVNIKEIYLISSSQEEVIL